MKLPPNVEQTLLQWATSRWTLLFARGLMILSPFLIAGLGWLVLAGGGDARARVAVVEKSVAAVAQTQGDRAKDSEAFQTEVRNSIADVNGKLYGLSIDVGVIKRLVTELRQDVKSASLPTPNPHADGRVIAAVVMP